MKGFRGRVRPSLLVVLATVIGIGGVAARDAMAESAATPRLTSDQIADAVLFNDGEAAGYLASLRRGPTPWSPELRTVQRDVHQAMAPDAYYAKGFTAAMQSGDPRAVSAALTRLGLTVRAVLEQRYGRPEVDKALDAVDAWWNEESLARGAIVNYQFVRLLEHHFVLDEDRSIHYALIAVVAVMSAVATVVAVVAGFGSDRPWSDRTSLAQEVFLGEVAAGLHHRG